ncbi:GGDEF domain-containing protein [Glaciecola sp. MF2-115]|uniref:GGDEF domain-containing protein n=1 Tax=Glaciecola sp. MF2-115 TaxID=3384827 RepID=UPI0039A0E4B8
MLAYWYKTLPQYPRNHIDFWRVRLISNIMLLVTILFLVLGAINLFAFQNLKLTALDFVGACISFSIHAWFRKTGLLVPAAWLATLMLSILVVIFIYSVNGVNNSILWATLIPPIAFFLLGKNWGTIFTVVVLLFCTYVSFSLYDSQVSQPYSFGSVLNMIEVMVVHILIFRFYEGARSEAYRDLRSKNQKIQILAETDKLTGLYNREKLDQSLSDMIGTLIPQDKPLTLLIIDIDHFKRINDVEGHLVGDNVLKQIAAKLQSKMREGDLLARWGGEEFVAVLPYTPLDNAMELADRLRLFISEQSIEGNNITISIGVTQCQASDSVEALFGRADKALYQAKVGGRDRVISAA